MARVAYVTPAGERIELEARNGTNLMKVAVSNAVPGIEGECGGELNCGTCHVLVSGPWSSRVAPRSEEEEEILEMDPAFCENSRLGCQIDLQDDIDGIEVTVPNA